MEGKINKNHIILVEVSKVNRIESFDQYEFDDIIIDGEIITSVHSEEEFDLDQFTSLRLKEDGTVILHKTFKQDKIYTESQLKQAFMAGENMNTQKEYRNFNSWFRRQEISFI